MRGCLQHAHHPADHPPPAAGGRRRRRRRHRASRLRVRQAPQEGRRRGRRRRASPAWPPRARSSTPGHSVVVLEARDRVGGRLLNAPIAGGHITEIGGEYVGPTQDRIKALAKAVGVERFPTYNSGSNVLIARGPALALRRGARHPGRPATRARASSSWFKIDALAKEVGVNGAVAGQARRGTGPPDARRLARREHLDARAGARSFDVAAEAIWGAEPEEMSLLYAARLRRRRRQRQDARQHPAR